MSYDPDDPRRWCHDLEPAHARAPAAGRYHVSYGPGASAAQGGAAETFELFFMNGRYNQQEFNEFQEKNEKTTITYRDGKFFFGETGMYITESRYLGGYEDTNVQHWLVTFELRSPQGFKTAQGTVLAYQYKQLCTFVIKIKNGPDFLGEFYENGLKGLGLRALPPSIQASTNFTDFPCIDRAPRRQRTRRRDVFNE